MMRKVLFVVVLSFYSVFIYSQGLDFDSYMYDTKLINPAFTAVENEQSFNIIYNTSPVSGNISEGLLSYDSHLANINSGIGVLLASERAGELTRTYIKFGYSYCHQLSDGGRIRFGGSVKHLSQSIKASEINTGDPVISHISDTRSYNADFGLVYVKSGFSIGAAFVNVFRTKSTDQLTAEIPRAGVSVFFTKEFSVNEWLDFRPSFYYVKGKEVGNSDFNAQFEIKNLVLGGLTYDISEHSKKIKLNAGVNYKDKVQLVVFTSSLDTFNNTQYVYEFMLRVKISQSAE